MISLTGKNFFILWTIFLILSITPACAAEIGGEINNKIVDSQTNADEITNSINSDTDELETNYNEMKIHTDRMDNSLEYIKSNWYKFWKWGTIKKKFTEIKIEADSLKAISPRIKDSAEKIKADTSALQASLHQNSTKTYNDYYVDKDAKGNADKMVNNIKRSLNVSLAVISAQNLTEGDIIQYKSQGKYYRYLQYVKTENGNVVLKGSRNKIVTISQTDFDSMKKYKLSNQSQVNSSMIVNQAFKIQKSEINKQINHVNGKKTESKKLLIAGASITGIGIGLIALGVVMTLLAVVAEIGGTGPLGLFLFYGGIATVALGVLLIPIGVILLGIGIPEGSIGDNNLNNLNLDLQDLNNYDDALNHPPVAENMNLTSNSTVINASLNASDIDGDNLTFTILNQPTHGTLKVENDGNFTYTVNNNSNGTDSFTYVANDGSLNSNNATVTLNTDVPPVANNMSITTMMDRSINTTFSVTDPDNGTLSYTVMTEPNHGTLNSTSDGNFIYTPTANYTGADNFTYKVNDGYFDSNIAVVTVTVSPDSPPVAYNMTLVTKKNKNIMRSFNITDPDKDILSIIITKQPGHGTLNITSDGRFIYTPAANYTGNDYFTYLGNDGFFNSNVARVTISIRN
jgi:VCBS repeat-containing protein